MPIERIPNTVQKKSTKKAVLTVKKIDGKRLQRYNIAAEAKKSAEAIMEKLKPAILSEGLSEIFRLNRDENPATVISSVNLTDSTDNSVRVSMQEVYTVKNPDELDSMFEQLDSDSGEYFTAGLKVNFDEAIFNDPATGNFSEHIFRKFQRAIERATKQVEAELREEGQVVSLKSPLTASEAFFPKPHFHRDRFRDFTVEQNLDIQRVAAAKIMITPIQP